MAFAHALILDPRTQIKYQRGEEVPDDLPGLDELQAQGVVSDEPYQEPEGSEDAVVLSAQQMNQLSPQVRHELQQLGLTNRHVTGSDSGEAGEAQA